MSQSDDRRIVPLVGRIEIEELSSARWDRIERGIFSELDSQVESEGEPIVDRQGPESSVRKSLPGAHIQETQGPPELRAPIPTGGRRKYANLGMLSLAAGVLLAVGVGAMSLTRSTEPPRTSARIVTGGSGSHLSVGASSLDVAPDSTVVVSGTDATGVVLVLERGSVTCDVGPRPGRAPFVVHAGNVRVRVVGTRFSVVRDGEGARVEVDRGTVEVTDGVAHVSVTAGQVFPARAAALDLRSAEPLRSAAPPVIPAASASAMASAARPLPITNRLPATTVSARRKYDEAAAREATDPEGARREYGRLEAEGGPWAANALYARARLAAERGEVARARADLATYLARYPNGPNASDARALLAQLAQPKP